MTLTLSLDDLTVPAPEPGPADWNGDGVVSLPGQLPVGPILDYMDCWKQSNAVDVVRPEGWPDCTPYMRHPEILELVAPLAPHLEQLIGEPAGMHLNLTGWVSTERDWHQDSYLNEPEVGDHYAAVWIALDDIDPRSGPFQYVPGSHRWPQVTRERIGCHVDLTDPAWPKHSEAILSPLFEQLITERQAPVATHLPARGDALIWHGRLLHRGSKAKVPGAYRPGFIAHFSGIHHRSTMPPAIEHPGGGWYFPLVGGPV